MNHLQKLRKTFWKMKSYFTPITSVSIRVYVYKFSCVFASIVIIPTV